MRSVLLTAVIILMAVSCGSSENHGSQPIADDVRVTDTDPELEIAAEWKEYFESSDDGLWENVPEHSLSYRYAGQFGVDNGLEPAVYVPVALCASGDTVFVTDLGTMQVVALDSEGNVLWKTGGEGEGPGEFSRMSSLAVSGRYLAVLNYRLSRIEFFQRDGSFESSINFLGAQDIAVIDHNTFIVASSGEPGGDLHIVNKENGVIRSFGEAELEHYDEFTRSDLMRICVSVSGKVALFNRYEGLLAIYDIATEECVYRGSRNYPATPTPPEDFIHSSGEERTMFFPVGGNVFCGPEGMLNVVVCNYMDDGSFVSDPEYLDFAPVTCVDRYDWDGSYLDSYCLPDSSLNYVAGLPDGRVVARNFSEGIICRMELVQGSD